MRRQVRPFVTEIKGRRSHRQPHPTFHPGVVVGDFTDSSSIPSGAFDDDGLPVRDVHSDDQPDYSFDEIRNYEDAMRAADSVFSSPRGDIISSVTALPASLPAPPPYNTSLKAALTIPPVILLPPPRLSAHSAAEALFKPIPTSETKRLITGRILPALDQRPDELQQRLAVAAERKRGRPLGVRNKARNDSVILLPDYSNISLNTPILEKTPEEIHEVVTSPLKKRGRPLGSKNKSQKPINKIWSEDAIKEADDALKQIPIKDRQTDFAPANGKELTVEVNFASTSEPSFFNTAYEDNVPASIKDEAEPIVRRPRGRPRKNPFSSVFPQMAWDAEVSLPEQEPLLNPNVSVPVTLQARKADIPSEARFVLLPRSRNERFALGEKWKKRLRYLRFKK